MKVTKAAGIQCVILVFILAVEIVFAGRYRAAYDTEQIADTDLQEDAQGNMEGSLSEEDAVSTLSGEAGSSDIGSGIENETEYPVYQIDEEEGIFLFAEARGDEKENFVYQDDKPGEPLQVLNGIVTFCGDINFDKYPDIKIYDNGKRESSYFLWDEKERQFVETVYAEEEAERVYIEEKLDNYRTFWGVPKCTER